MKIRGELLQHPFSEGIPVRIMNKVAIVKCSNYSTLNVKDAMMKSFDFFGGVGNFVKKGERILLKPNLIVASKGNGATTDAHFIEAAIEIVKDRLFL